MTFSFAQIINLLVVYKYLFLFPITVFEGPIVTIIAGFLSSIGIFNFFLAYIVIVVGDLVGDCFYYSIGRFGRKGFLERWGHYIGITPERISNLESHFDKHSGKTLIIGKLTAVGAILLVAAGVAKMPLGKFIWYNFLPTVPKSFILLLIGYYFGQAYLTWDKYLKYTALSTIGLLILVVAVYFLIKKIRSRYEY
jgi:membrane protein DedA with SNARE-associated domain